MQFDSSYITTAGSELFARATASANSSVSHPIVWGSVYTSKTDMRSLTREEMRALTSIPENERSSSGSVTSARHDVIDGNHIVKLECEINNKQYHGSAYAIGIYAKLDSDSNEVLAAIARVDTNGSTPDIIQQSGEYLAIIDFAIAIRDDQFNIQKVDSSYYASAKSMQDLANRVVTTHVESDVTVGEDQEIRGSKYFQNGIMLNGQDGRSCIEFTDIYGRQDVACTVSISPQSRGVGISYGAHLFTDNDCILEMDLSDGTMLYELTKKRASYHVPELYVDGLVTNSINVDTGEDITLKANVVPMGDNVSVGTSTTPFNNIHATNLNATNIKCTNVDASFITASIGFNTTRSFQAFTANQSTATTEDVALTPKGLRASKQVGGSSPLYSNLYADSTGFKFCINTNDSANYSMSVDDAAVKTEVPLYIDKGAELAKDQVLKLNGKVECTTGWTDQVMLAVPKLATTVVDASNKVYTADIPVGGIVLLYDQIGKFGRGSLGIEAGKRFPVGENDMRIAMSIGSGAETSIPNYTWLGNSANFQAATGKNKIYAPSGYYVALMGATATAPDHWVAVLALRYAE